MVWFGTSKRHIYYLDESHLSCVYQHAVTYPISSSVLNVLFFTTDPDGFGKPLTTATVSAATREEILKDYQDWDPDLRMVAEVRLREHLTN